MANPFKEAEKAKKTAPGNKQETVVKAEPVEKKEAPVKKTPVQEKPAERPAEKGEKEKTLSRRGVEDIFAGLETVKPAGKTYAFYLSDDNVKKLKKKAEKMGISTSKLLDHILSEIL